MLGRSLPNIPETALRVFVRDILNAYDKTQPKRLTKQEKRGLLVSYEKSCHGDEWWAVEDQIVPQIDEFLNASNE